MGRENIRKPVRHRQSHYRNSSIRSGIFRITPDVKVHGAKEQTGQYSCRSVVNQSAAQFIRESPLKRALNRTSTPWMLNGKPARPIFKVSGMRGGEKSPPLTTMAAIPAGTWNDPHFSGYSPTSRRAK